MHCRRGSGSAGGQRGRFRPVGQPVGASSAAGCSVGAAGQGLVSSACDSSHEAERATEDSQPAEPLSGVVGRASVRSSNSGACVLTNLLFDRTFRNFSSSEREAHDTMPVVHGTRGASRIRIAGGAVTRLEVSAAGLGQWGIRSGRAARRDAPSAPLERLGGGRWRAASSACVTRTPRRSTVPHLGSCRFAFGTYPSQT